MELLIGESLLTDGLLVAVVLSGIPLVGVMFVGVVAAILQAATQIQEQTLGFVPKLCAAVLVLWWGAPWMWLQVQLLFTSALTGDPYTL